MSKKLKSAFIIMGHDDRCALPDGNAEMVGAISLDDAVEKAAALKAAGCDFIELCGAFNEDMARKVASAADNSIPVGYITHLPEQDELFSKIWAPGKKTSFAFVIIGHTGRACFKDGYTNIVGVTDMADAAEKAKALADEGIECIEICGAFGPDGAKKLIEASGGKMGVGYTVNLPELMPLAAQLFGKK